MKKVLFITYFWPPSGKATLHWPLKIIKHLPEYGWQPTVLTVDEDTFSQKDESLLKEVPPSVEVVKSKSLEPFTLYRSFIGKKKDEQLIASETISTETKSLAHRISIWIRMNLFIPDARVGWYLSAVKTGSQVLKGSNFSAIISLGPPHSVHLIGMKLSKKYNLPHFPVFIDPWVDIIYYRNFKRSWLTLKLDNYLEKKVMLNSKRIIFVTNSTNEDYIKKYSFLKNKTDVLYWGYNEDDFQKVVNENSAADSSGGKHDFETLVHAGNIFDYQNPKNFWRTLKNEINSGRNIKIKFIGSVGPGIIKSIKEAGLEEHTSYAGFLPYKDMLGELLLASYLMVCSSEKRHLPGKLFEYLRTGKPIIAFGDDNEEVKEILAKTNAGMIYSYDSFAKEFFASAKKFKPDMTLINIYNRKEIANRFAEILKTS